MKRTLLIASIITAACLALNAQKPHVYINPGHGGHGSDDRNVVIPPFTAGDTLGFWESNSNLWKGFALQEVLRKKGYRTSISRLKNEESNDLLLSTIVALCNNSGADVFYSIHSNASGYGDSHAYNYPMGIYRGYTGQPQVANSDKLTADLGETLIENKSTVWSNGGHYVIYGDWTFYPDWGLQGLGVLRGNKATSMLSEGSFHDYYPEAYRLLSHDYDWVEGWNFSIGADRYFGRLDQYDMGIITGCIRDDRVLRVASYQMLDADKREPVVRANVRLLDTEGNEVAVAHSDSLWNGIYLFKYVEPGTYRVEASSPLHELMTKEVEVRPNESTYCNFDLKKIRNTAPEVIAYSPHWADGDKPLLCNVPVVMEFNWDMDTESVAEAFTITPEVKGTIRWEDSNYRMVFTPDNAYATDTHYTVTLAASACHGGGTSMGEDFSFSFTTDSRRHLEQLTMFPTEGAEIHFTKPVIEFRTDSLMDTYDLNKHFHVFDNEGNELTYLKRSIKNNKKSDPYGYIRLPLAKDLTPDADYRLVVDRDVADYDGIHLPDTIRLTFKAVDAAKHPAVTSSVDIEGDADVTLSGVYATAKVASSTSHLLGAKSLQVDYQFDDSNADSQVRLAMSTPHTFNMGDSVAALLWGDMSFNDVAAVMTDAHGDETLLPLSAIDFHGWRWVSAPVTMPGSYRFTGLEVTRPDDDRMAQQGVSGTMLVDAVSLLRRTGGSSVCDVQLRGVSVSPNPASDYLVATADTYISGVELFATDGHLVSRNAANYINVSDIAAGVYVMKVYVNGQVSIHKVMVTH